MRIFKIAAPLPLYVTPEYRGEGRVDSKLSNQDVEFLTKKFKLISYLSGGYWGIAYKTADGKVLKITADEEEAEISTLLMLGNFSSGPFASVYDVGVIGKNSQLHYILKEQVTPLSEYERTLFNQAMEEHYKIAPKDYIYIAPKDYIYNDFNFSEADKLKIQEFKDYIADVLTYPLHDTISNTNVGYNKNGKVVCFDPSF